MRRYLYIRRIERSSGGNVTGLGITPQQYYKAQHKVSRGTLSDVRDRVIKKFAKKHDASILHDGERWHCHSLKTRTTIIRRSP